MAFLLLEIKNDKLLGKIKNAAAFRTLHLLSDDSAAVRNLRPWQWHAKRLYP